MVGSLSDFLFLCSFGAGLGEDAMIGAFGLLLRATQWIEHWMYYDIVSTSVMLSYLIIEYLFKVCIDPGGGGGYSDIFIHT